ncbi:MAG TPA: ABC transporter permease [Streptosporangiaceae bacterium]|nr:ABC transporter permease [Streptosporangiaceae bacterium]
MALSTSTGLGTAPAADDGTGKPGAVPAAPRRGRRPRLRLPRSPKVLIGLALILVFLVVAVFGSTLAPYDPSRTFSLTESFPLPPSAHHLLGTTQQQQDVLSQLLVGTRSTVLVAFIAGMIATILSVVIGVTAGYQGRLADDVLSMLANFFLVLPALPLLIVIFGFLKTNQGGHDLLIGVVIALTGWAWGARVLRAQTLSLRSRDYVDAARISGERSWRIITFEIMPNLVPIMAASFLFTVLYAVGTYTALAFLGLVNPNHWSWGSELFYAQVAGGVSAGYWWLFIPPGLAVALLGTALALVNFGIDEFINPRLRADGVSRRRARRARRAGRTALPRRFVLGVTPVVRPEVPETAGGAPPGQRPVADLITTDHGKTRRGRRGSGQPGSGL